jgi:hypothetical protein
MIWWIVLAGIVLTFAPILWLTGIRRRKPGQTEMVLIGAASGELEVHTWAAALRSAGIHPHVINVGDLGGRFGGIASSPYGYEVWVPARDAARARQALGFH